ncbi:MAG: flagellin [Candidatus Bathyarchaeota archaeon]|nr:flagellin [Candidatus Bathyarchaeota archaeon]
MGFSLTLSHIIMVIASVCLASVFSAYAFYTGNLIQNELAQNVNNYKITVNIRLEIVYATINNTTTPPHFVIYAKNTGNLPFVDFTFLDVYVGEYGKAQLYTYSETASSGSGKYSISTANGDNIWEPRETAVIKVYPTGNVEGIVFEAKLVPSKGIGSSHLFSAPPS